MYIELDAEIPEDIKGYVLAAREMHGDLDTLERGIVSKRKQVEQIKQQIYHMETAKMELETRFAAMLTRLGQHYFDTIGAFVREHPPMSFNDFTLGDHVRPLVLLGYENDPVRGLTMESRGKIVDMDHEDQTIEVEWNISGQNRFESTGWHNAEQLELVKEKQD